MPSSNVRTFITLAVLVGIAVGGYFLFFSDPDYTDQYGPGVVAPDVPRQTSPTSDDEFPFKGFTIEPVADFVVTARVLGRKHYSSDTEAKLSPVDLALGWGRMSDESILKSISISQRGRFYFWKTPRFPIPRDEIENCSANMHMIPRDDEVEAALKAVERGQVVTVEGMLVNVYRKDGWRWLSSTKRSDTGHGACEVVYVNAVRVIQPGR